MRRLILFLSLVNVQMETANANLWVPVLNCDNGAATVEVNNQNLKNFKTVITNKRIVGYLSRGLGLPGDDCSLHPYGKCLTKKGDLVYFSESAGTSGNKFIWMRANLYVGSLTGGIGTETRNIDVGVYREGPGLKVKEFSDSKRVIASCDTRREHCEYYAEPAKNVELVNWYFQSCEDLR
jgi:hypothetical protein